VFEIESKTTQTKYEIPRRSRRSITVDRLSRERSRSRVSSIVDRESVDYQDSHGKYESPVKISQLSSKQFSFSGSRSVDRRQNRLDFDVNKATGFNFNQRRKNEIIKGALNGKNTEFRSPSDRVKTLKIETKNDTAPQLKTIDVGNELDYFHSKSAARVTNINARNYHSPKNGKTQLRFTTRNIEFEDHNTPISPNIPDLMKRSASHGNVYNNLRSSNLTNVLQHRQSIPQ
jgi:hypothetical protein